MKNNNKILFLINGLGLGNSTRCEAIIRELILKGYSISVATSGNGFKYFKKSDLSLTITRLYQHEYGKSQDGNLSILKTILNIPLMAIAFLKNLKILFPLVRDKNLSAIFFDSEYSILPLKPFCRTFIIGINNANIVIRYLSQNRPISRNLYPQYIVENLDRLYYAVTADHIICPTLSSDTILKEKITYCPPLIRKTLSRNKPTPLIKNGLVMLSGSSFKTDLNFLKHTDLRHINWEIIGQTQIVNGIDSPGKVYRNENKINNADIMIINAGFSAVSEAAVLGIPSLVLPVKNHAEQFVNAKIYNELQLGIEGTPNKEKECLDKLIKDYQKYISTSNLPNGIDCAMKRILELIERYDR